MRVVNLKEFLEIDHEVVYSEYDKDIITYELCIKQHHISDSDWERVNIPEAFDTSISTPDGFLIDEVVNGDMVNGKFNFYNAYTYDSCVRDDENENRQFIVWNEEDIKGLINRLNDVLTSQANKIPATDMFTTYEKEGR